MQLPMPGDVRYVVLYATYRSWSWSSLQLEPLRSVQQSMQWQLVFGCGHLIGAC